MEQTKRPWWKWALAAVGLCYLLGAAVWAAHAYVTRDTKPKGPSELAAHPERQAEILARRRAEEMRDQLGLTEEQTARLAAIFQEEPQPGDGGDFRERGRAMREKIMAVLTPEQRAKMEQERGPMGGPPPGMGAGGPGGMPPGGPPPGGPPPGGMGMMGGPGGPGGRVTPERIESLKASMTPEQRERFEKSLQRMQERRGQGRGPGGGSGGRGGQRPQGPPPQ